MDLADRIDRRTTAGRKSGLVLDAYALSPVAHLDEPVGRGPEIERLLDALEPVFRGELPPTIRLSGPAGSGKSAVVSAVFDHLDRQVSSPRPAIYTTTRARSGADSIAFVYVDARRAESPFRLYHAVLDGLLDEPVPERGVGTDALREELGVELRRRGRGVLAAFDHCGEPETPDYGEIDRLFSPFDASLSRVVVGRDPPSGAARRTVGFASYTSPALEEVLAARATIGLSRGGFDRSQLRRLTDWADGNAHDALCALYAAAQFATDDGAARIRDEDVDRALSEVPRDGVSIGAVLALPENRQAVLETLLSLGSGARTVEATADAIAARSSLSSGTVKRFLYEFAESGILERVAVEAETNGSGRNPSRVVPRFATSVFTRLRADRRARPR